MLSPLPDVASRFGPQAVASLRMAFMRSGNPMLIADDQRRWVTGNAAACELLGIDSGEIPWRTMDEFTPPSEQARLEEQWRAFIAKGAAEGWHRLYVPERGPVAVEFSATANVLAGRHLSVLIPPDEGLMTEKRPIRQATWTPVDAEDHGRRPLTEREREVLTLVASGLQSGDVAERLYVSIDTVKSHVQHALGKLGAHTRAHAVAVAMVTGQIAWGDNGSSDDDSPPGEGAR